MKITIKGIDFKPAAINVVHEEISIKDFVNGNWILPNEQRKERQKTNKEIQDDLLCLVTCDYIPPITVVIKNEKNELPDGGHRFRGISRFVNNEISLNIEQEKIYFKDLSIENQNRILQHTIGLEKISGQDADSGKIFTKCNSGKTVSKMEKIHSKYYFTDAWKLSEKFISYPGLKKLIGSTGVDFNNGYKMTETILQTLGLIYYNDHFKVTTSKQNAMLHLLEAKITKKELNVLEKKATCIFDTIITEQLCMHFYDSSRRGKKSHKLNFSNLSYVISNLGNNSLLETKKILNKMKKRDFSLKLQECIQNTNYSIECKDGKAFFKQFSELEKAVTEALIL